MSVRTLLDKRYGGEQWIFLEEVRDRPGFNASRSVDAVAMGLWLSRGCEVIGFEVKESRSDWLRELKQPEKAECAFNLCDRFYLATTKDVAKLDEIPATWGWLEAAGSRLIEKKRAPLRPGSDGVIDRLFVAMMLRRAKSPTEPGRIREKAREMADVDMKDERERHEKSRKRLEDEVGLLREDVRKFKAALGTYAPNFEEIASTFKALDAMRDRRATHPHEYQPDATIESAAGQLEHRARMLRDAAKEVRKFIEQASKEVECTKPT